MNEEKYFLNDEYESANEHAEFDLENDEDVENLYWYVRGLQQKLGYITTCYDLQSNLKKKKKIDIANLRLMLNVDY